MRSPICGKNLKGTENKFASPSLTTTRVPVCLACLVLSGRALLANYLTAYTIAPSTTATSVVAISRVRRRTAQTKHSKALCPMQYIA